MPTPEEQEAIDRGDVLTDSLSDETSDELELDPKAAKPEDDKGEADKEEGEGDETDEEKAEREAAEAAENAEADKAKRIRIPKARFDEAVNKARAREEALKQEIAELRNGQRRQADSASLQDLIKSTDELQDKYEDLILDGMKDEARKVRKQLEDAREQVFEARTNAKAQQTRSATIEELRYEADLASVEATWPQLNPDSPDTFDADAVEEVATLMEAFTAKGMARSTALKKAVKYVVGEAPAPVASDAKATDDLKKARDARDQAARAKAAAANKQQPADQSAVGKDSDKAGKQSNVTTVDVMRMSQAQFAKVDEDTLARLRGDVI